jgi:hypothetical protein
MNKNMPKISLPERRDRNPDINVIDILKNIPEGIIYLQVDTVRYCVTGYRRICGKEFYAFIKAESDLDEYFVSWFIDTVKILFLDNNLWTSNDRKKPKSKKWGFNLTHANFICKQTHVAVENASKVAVKFLSVNLRKRGWYPTDKISLACRLSPSALARTYRVMPEVLHSFLRDWKVTGLVRTIAIVTLRDIVTRNWDYDNRDYHATFAKFMNMIPGWMRRTYFPTPRMGMIDFNYLREVPTGHKYDLAMKASVMYACFGVSSMRGFATKESVTIKDKVLMYLLNDKKTILKMSKLVRSEGLPSWNIRSKDSIKMLLLWIEDGERIYCNNTNAEGMEEVKGSVLEMIRASGRNHRQMRLIDSIANAADDNIPMPCNDELPKNLEAIRIKTRGEMRIAGKELGHCIASYRTCPDSWFFRKNTCCAQVRMIDHKVVQCYDSQDRVTQASKNLQKYITMELRKMKRKK